MKAETLMLRCLFIACLVVCGWTMSAMLFTPGPVQLTGIDNANAVLNAVPGACMLPPDGVVCPRLDG